MSVKEKGYGGFMYPEHLGEYWNFSHMARHPLAQGIVPSFDKSGLPVPFLARSVLVPEHEDRTRFPAIRVHESPAITYRQVFPKVPSRRFCMIHEDVSGRSFTVPGEHGQLQRNPQRLSSHIAPEFIEFEHRAYNGAGGFNCHRGQTPQFLQEPL